MICMSYGNNIKFGLLQFHSGYGNFYLNSPKGYSWKIINAQTALVIVVKGLKTMLYRNIRTIKIGISFIIYGFRYGIDGEKEPKVSMPFFTTSTYTWDEQKPQCIARGSFKNHVCEISSTRAEQLKLLQ